MECLFNRNNTAFRMFSIQLTKPVWMMKNLASFGRNVSFHPVYEMSRVWWVLYFQYFGVRLCGLLLLFAFVVPAQWYPPASSPASWAPSSPSSHGMQELLRETAIKSLTCLLLRFVTYKYLCYLEPAWVWSKVPPGFSGNKLKSRRAFPFFPPPFRCVSSCISIFPPQAIPRDPGFYEEGWFWPRSLQRLLLISALWLGLARINVQQTNAA